MLNSYRVELLNLLNDHLGGREITSHLSGSVATANAVVQLMHFTIETLPPMDVINVFNAHEGRARTARMWSVLRNRTAEIEGDRIPVSRLRAQIKARLRSWYMDDD